MFREHRSICGAVLSICGDDRKNHGAVVSIYEDDRFIHRAVVSTFLHDRSIREAVVSRFRHHRSKKGAVLSTDGDDRFMERQVLVAIGAASPADSSHRPGRRQRFPSKTRRLRIQAARTRGAGGATSSA